MICLCMYSCAMKQPAVPGWMLGDRLDQSSVSGLPACAVSLEYDVLTPPFLSPSGFTVHSPHSHVAQLVTNTSHLTSHTYTDSPRTTHSTSSHHSPSYLSIHQREQQTWVAFQVTSKSSYIRSIRQLGYTPISSLSNQRC